MGTAVHCNVGGNGVRGKISFGFSSRRYSNFMEISSAVLEFLLGEK
jgi:hypothetical protein